MVRNTCNSPSKPWFLEVFDIRLTGLLSIKGGLEHVFIFPYIGNSNPNWLSYFSEGLKPPTSCVSGLCLFEPWIEASSMRMRLDTVFGSMPGQSTPPAIGKSNRGPDISMGKWWNILYKWCFNGKIVKLNEDAPCHIWLPEAIQCFSMLCLNLESWL